MNEDELSSRFDQVREYVDLAVPMPGMVNPTADDRIGQRARSQNWAGRRRVVLPVLSAVIVLVVAISMVIATHRHTARHPAALPSVSHAVTGLPLACPSAPPRASSPTDNYPLPPPGPQPLTVTDRLVPTTAPVRAIVCAYVPSQRLTGTRTFDTGLASIPATLGFDPPQQNQPPCPSYFRVADADIYLIGLTYPSGTLWVSAPDNHCLGSSNGTFTTSTHVATAAIQAYRTGSWASPAPDGATECRSSSGRLGQQSALVPGAPVSLVVCRDSGAQPVGTATGAELSAIVAALNRLSTALDTFAFQCGSLGRPAVSYDLLFRYSVGPPVVVDIVEGCSPAVHNGNLQATDAATILPILQHILNH